MNCSLERALRYTILCNVCVVEWSRWIYLLYVASIKHELVGRLMLYVPGTRYAI